MHTATCSRLEINPLRDPQGIIYFNTEIASGTLQPDMPKQSLYCAHISCLLIDTRGCCAPVCDGLERVKLNTPDPNINDPGILLRR